MASAVSVGLAAYAATDWWRCGRAAGVKILASVRWIARRSRSTAGGESVDMRRLDVVCSKALQLGSKVIDADEEDIGFRSRC